MILKSFVTAPPRYHATLLSLVTLFFSITACEDFRNDDDPVPEESLTVSTVAGGDGPGFQDGAGSEARFSSPGAIVVDSAGNLYVADQGNHCIRMITPDGQVSTYAGTGQPGFDNGDRAVATFNNPYGLALDAAGNLYVGDVLNHAIRKITPEGIVTTLAGGNKGFSDRDGEVARFNHPHGVAVDTQGNVYVADAQNNRIRKVSSEGEVSTLAGTGIDGFVDGPATAAEFFVPIGIVVDTHGTVYVGDEGNSSIRMITADGHVSTLAGNGRFSFSDGVGKSAEFNAPGGIALDTAGNLYVADYFNNCIRQVTPSGAVQKIAGNLEKGFADGESSEARFHYPFGVAVDAGGAVYVGDQLNHRVRKIF